MPRPPRSSVVLRIFAVIAAATLWIIIASAPAHAALSVPHRMVFNSRLLSPSGVPITTEHKVRFSFWIGADAVPSDLTGSGTINLFAPNFVGWKEEQIFTPAGNGAFYVEMGAVNPLPSFASLPPATLSNLFMQVEVKPASATDSAYEILDPRPLDATIDRSPVLSVPFALNADRLDQRDVGTGSGSIPLLLSGGLLPVRTVPGGTNRDTFVIDNNNTASSAVTLKFGETLGKTLSYDTANGWFVFNDDLRVQGNLTVTGLINGVDVTALNTAAPLRASSGGGLRVNVFSGSYRINGHIANYAGSGVTLTNNADNFVFFTGTGLVARPSGFPTNVSFIPVAKITTQNGGIASVTDRRVTQSDDREHTVLDVLHPGYPSAAYDADGSSNVGQLTVDHDGSSKHNVYQWTSTKGTLNDYDIIVRTTLPQTFVRWQAIPLKLHYRTSSADAAESKVDIEVYDTAGNAVTLGGSSAGLASTAWTSTSLTFTGSPTWTAGQSFVIKLRLSAKDARTVHVGDLELSTVTLDR